MPALDAVVVGVGDELLSGVVVNTNASMIGSRLLGIGVRVVRSVCVGDREDDIADAVSAAARTAGVVVVTGGLGPTQDDLTREALARMLDVPLVRDPEIVEEIRRRFTSMGRAMPEANAKQADLPAGAEAIPNPWGTAPGIRAAVGDSVVYAIPGVPGEARRMMDERILPELAERAGADGGAVRFRELRCIGMAESELAARLADLATAAEPKLAFLPGGGEVRLRFVATGPSPDGCEDALDGAEATVRERLGVAVYASGEDTLEAVVGRLLSTHGRTIATAESCTAGLLAGRLAAVPGAGDYLRGGIVSYMTDVKASLLDVDEGILEREGPVCEATAAAMADGARRKLAADIGVSVTCAAGPDPQEGADVGTTFIALAASDASIVRGLKLPGDREQVRSFAVTFSLNLLRLYLLGERLD